MNVRSRWCRSRRFTLLSVVLVLVAGFAGRAIAGDVDLELRRKALSSHGPSEHIPVIIHLTDKADLSLIRDRDKNVRRSKIIKALQSKADGSQKEVIAHLKRRMAKRILPFWIINGIAATVRPNVVDELAALPGVERVTLDAIVHAPVTTYDTQTTQEWNISAIHAPDLWGMGYTGQGVVVANIDTGVDLDHPDLQGRWRGGANSWYSPYSLPANAASCKTPGQCTACELSTAPCDVDGHGTQTMGIMVGGDAGGTSIGVAPGAHWIAVKIFNDAGDAPYSVIHQAFQWLLDPDGNPETNDAPDVVNNSWGLQNTNVCDTTFQPDVQTLNAVGIAVVFAAGNSGPNSSTSESPANYPESFAVGSLNQTLTIDYTSSRGPSACDGSIFPEVVAPGVNVRTSDLTFGGVFPNSYQYVSGTSFSAPHVAGAMALLLSAFPGVTVIKLESTLKRSAIDLGPGGADNDYGYGLINILNAYTILSNIDKIGIFRAGQWYLDMNGNSSWDPDIETIYNFGIPGDIPVIGDWDGSGKTKIGVFRNGYWYLDINGDGVWDAGDVVYNFGILDDIPITGDWDGDGRTKIGVFRNGYWYLDLNGNGVWDAGDVVSLFGIPGDTPVTGDWNGDGKTKIGIYRGGYYWYLDMSGDGAWGVGDVVYNFGIPGDVPITGDWDGTGKTKIGVYRGGYYWYLDMSGDGAWGIGDVVYNFGIPGDVPVIGKW